MNQNTKLYVYGIVGGLLVALVVILVVSLMGDKKETVTINPENFVSWHALTPEDGLFTASMPTGASETSEYVPVGDSDESLLQKTYSSTDETGNGFLIMTLVYPSAFDEAKTDEVLGSALDGMINAVPGNQLANSEFETFNGLRALDFAMTNDTVNYQGKLMLQGRVLYQALVTYEDGALSDETLAYFLSSFEPTQP